MEFCPRCQGGAIDAPNCPLCGGCGWISDPTSVGQPARTEARPAPPMRHPSERPNPRRKHRHQQSITPLPPMTADSARETDYTILRERRRKALARQQEVQAGQKALAKRNRAAARAARRAQAKADAQAKERAKARRELQKKWRPGATDADPRQRDVLSRDLQPAGTLGTIVEGPLQSPRKSSNGATTQRAKTSPQRASTKQHARPRKHPSREEQSARQVRNNQLGESLREYRVLFTTVVPGPGQEEDGGRDTGQSFRDGGGQFGSMPLYDDYDE